MEFLASICIRKKKGVHDRQNITFCLRGEQRELSLADFALRTELYLPSELHTKSYTEFISHCLNSSEEFKESNYWTTIANRVYQSKTAQESDIRSPIFRLLHWLITNTINQRQEGDKVPILDVFYLWSLIYLGYWWIFLVMLSIF